jgi:hypothetical protein
VEFRSDDLLPAVADGHVLPAIAPRRVTTVDLGQVGSVPLCFTDACALPDGSWLFSAVAEDTDDAFADGALLGAAIGLMTPAEGISWLRPLDPACKVEGLAGEAHGDRLALWCVTDADDRASAAQLLEASLQR